MAVAEKPEYVIAITANSPGVMHNPRTVMLRGSRSGKPGNEAEGAEAVSRSQAVGSGESYNWLIDFDGTIYELTGWDRAAWGMRAGSYVICLSQPLASDGIRPAQYESLSWLMLRLERKKGIPRTPDRYISTLGPGFDWSNLGT
jgi:hypothetical protein